MSGSGNGGYVPPQKTIFACETSTISTTLSSVDLDLLKKLEVGDKLEVLIGARDTLVVNNNDGELIGSIIHGNTSDIIECIKEGTEYEATVLAINFPSCRISIKSI
jgi:hypothetical protein